MAERRAEMRAFFMPITTVRGFMSKEKKVETVKVQVVATDMGYYNNRIIRAGEKFTYEGALKNGKLPLWVSKAGSKKAKVEVIEEDDSEVSDIV
jgi:hypothetical protein